MVAIFTGAGSGLERGSASILGGAGVLGSAAQGRSGEQLLLNAATGNLLISQRDEFLVGRGPDSAISRTYNSLGDMSDDNGDNWRQSTDRRVHALTGTLNTAGSTVRRVSGDGSDILYTWNAAAAAYLTAEGAGTVDKLTSAAGIWTWTDGDTQLRETYAAYGALWRISQQIDEDGNALTFTYTGANLTRVATADGSYTDYGWSGNNITQIVTGYTDLVAGTAKTLTRTRYFYDASNRLSSVKVDITPGDNSIADNNAYVTTYTYVGTSKRVQTISQTDGSAMTIGYDSAGRVTSLTQTAVAGVTRVTTIAYNGTHTLVTDPAGQVTRLDYLNDGSLTKITAPPAQAGAAPQIVQFEYAPASASPPLTNGGGSQISGGVVTKTAAAGWGNQIAYGDQAMTGTAMVQFKFDNPNTAGKWQQAGLATHANRTVAGTDWSNGGFAAAIYFDDVSNALMMYDGVAWTRSSVTGTSADVWTIAYDGTKFDFLKNGVLFHSRAAAANLALVAKHRAYSLGAVIRDISYGTLAAGSTARQAGRLTKVTDALGNPTTYSYDSNGNILTVVDRLGTPVHRTYSAKNELLTEWTYGSYYYSGNGQLSTRYAYDSEGHLRFKVAADAGVTEYRYKPTGELEYIIEYPEHFYNLAGYNLDTPVTEAQLIAWRDGLADRNSTKITYNLYDSRGQITLSDRYSASTVGGAGTQAQGYSRTVYTYDQAGQLLKRIAGDQQAELFVYDGLGRITASTDPNQGTTSIVFNDALTQTVVTLASGYVKTSTYNLAGDLISVTDSGSFVAGGTTTHKYDKLGRLRMTTDATGFDTYFVYDKVGRLVAEVNDRGDLIEHKYDANGRKVATARYINAVTAANLATLANPDSTIEMSTLRPAWNHLDIGNWTTYDKEGRITSTMDGTIRTFEYDASGRLVKTVAYYNGLTWEQIIAFQVNPPSAPVVPTADARDVVTRLFYDALGREQATLDGEGYLTFNYYDGAGQLVRRTAYFHPSVAAYRATGTLAQLAATQPVSNSDRHTRFVYDSQGLLRYEVDAHNQVVEYGYDTARQLISTIRYAGSIAATTDYTWDNVKALVASSGLASAPATRRSWNVYHNSGLLAYTIDAEGAVAAYSYNNIGKVTKTVQFAVARPTTTAPSANDMGGWASGQLANSANRVTRHYYTAAGQLKFTVDAEGYLSRTDYDSAGRTIGEYRWDTAVSVSDSTTINTIDTLQTGTWTGQWYSYAFGGPVTDVHNADNGWMRYNYLSTGQKQMEINLRTDSNYTYFSYNLWGRLIARTDAYGAAESSAVQYDYDGLGNLKTVIDGRNNATHRTFDKLGRVLTETDAAGGMAGYEYNGFGEVTKVTDARGHATVKTYDNLGRLHTTTDALGGVTTNGYNVFGDLVAVTRGTATTSFEYDRLGRVVKSIDAEGHYEQYTLDAFGNRTGVRNKIGGTVANSFDRRGLLVAEILPMTSTDSNGNVVAAAVTNKFEYDARGNRTKKIEAFGLAEQRTTIYSYDRLDRLVQTRGDAVSTMNADWVNSTGGVIPTETIIYDRRGQLIERVDSGGARTLYYYNQMKQVTVELGATGTYTAFTYDKNGNVLTRRVYATAMALPGSAEDATPAPPAGEYRETVYTYDALNRLKTTSVANIRTGAWNSGAYAYATIASTTVTTTLDYDSNGNVLRTVDGNGVAAYAYYDKLNRRIAQVDAEGYLTFYTLDGEGNVIQEDRYATGYAGATATSDPNAIRSAVAAGGARTTQFTYDKNGRRLTETRLNVNSHALDGNAALVGGAAHATISYAYNGLGEVTQKTEANGDYVTYAYDSTGRLILENRAPYLDQNGASVRPTIAYSYNGLNELSVTRQGGVAAAAGDRYTRYTYGAGGRVATMTDANGATYTYYYDAGGNVMRESYSRYKADGSFTIDSLLYTRDTLGRVTSQGLASWNGSAWVHGDRQNSAYNAYGDVAQRGVNGMWQEQLFYDRAGRLWKTNGGDGVWRFFVYDGAGNRTLTIESEGTDLSAHNLDQAIAAASYGGTVGGGFVDGVNATIAEFDKRGQQLATRLPFRELKAGVVQFLASGRAYNAYGEVTSEIDARGSTTDFAYDAMGRLKQKASPTVSYTNAGGTVASARPIDYYYYDISGRMIATDDANGNRIRRALLAGTGHGGTEALVTAEYHPDGGVFRTYYDVFGDARILRDELGNDETRFYDAMGRLTQSTHRGGLLVDYYSYDLLGQRTKHWNSALGSGNVEVTDYDMQGRVTRNIVFGGDTTTTSYVWNGAIATTGLGTFGGWTRTTSRSGVSSSVQLDVHGRDVSRSDFAGQAYYYSYDKAGRLTSQTGPGQSQTTSYFNTGRASQIVDSPGVGYGITSTFGYDAGGYRTYEGHYSAGSGTLQNATIDYDSNGRMTAFTDRDGAGTIKRSFTNAYDLAGNIRRSTSSFPDVAYPQYANYTTDYWFAYDSMNRMTVANGQLVGGAIVAGNTGVSLTYDAAGRRRTATQKVAMVGYVEVWVPDGDPGPPYEYEVPIGSEQGHWETRQSNYMGTRREEYTYRDDGYLMNVHFADEGYYDGGGYSVNNGVMGAAALRASNARDALGRVTQYYELGAAADVTYNRYNIVYDGASRVTSEILSQKRLEGSWHTYTTTTTNSYAGAGGSLSYSAASTHNSWYDGSSTTASSTSYSYVWWDEARVSSSTHDSNTGSGSNPLFTSTYSYDGLGRLASVYIADGRPRTVTFTSNPNGQVLSRIESSAAAKNPADYYYFVDGVQVGELSNNGNHDLTRATYSETFVTRNWNFNQNMTSQPFRWNTTGGVTRGQFGGSGYDPISPTSQGMEGTDSRYQVREGDTLQGIAQQLFGDSSLWYMLAEANGLSGAQSLAAGTSLIVPDKVTNIHNSARTFEVYDPNRALGDLSPTAAKPPKKAGKCGMFGVVLLVVVAVAVTALTAGAAVAALSPVASVTGIGSALSAIAAGGTGLGLGALAGIGAAAGAIGSIASQGLGVATGIQDKFSWKAVAMAGIAGGISGGLGAALPGGQLGTLATIGRGAFLGAAGSALSQGVGVAVGLQKKFDFAGVAAAGIAGGVSAGVGKVAGAGSLSDLSARNISANVVTSAAGAIANAATRSLINGTDFGDNLMAALPDIIGSTIGNMIAGRFAKSAAYDGDGIQQEGEEGNSLTTTKGAATPGPGEIEDEPEVDLLSPVRTNLQRYLDGLQGRTAFDLGEVSLAQGGIGALELSALLAGVPTNRGYLDYPTRYILAPGQPIDREMALHYARALGIDPEAPIFIGGGGEDYINDPGTVEDYVDDRGAGNYFRHYENLRIDSAVEIAFALGKPIIIVGHSWGGDRALETAFRALRRGIPIDMLVTIDPVTGAGGIVPFGAENHSPMDYRRLARDLAGLWVNVRATGYEYSREPGGLRSSDGIATVGGRMRHEDQNRAHVYFESRVRHGDFRPMMRQAKVEQMISSIYLNHHNRGR